MSPSRALLVDVLCAKTAEVDILDVIGIVNPIDDELERGFATTGPASAAEELSLLSGCCHGGKTCVNNDDINLMELRHPDNFVINTFGVSSRNQLMEPAARPAADNREGSLRRRRGSPLCSGQTPSNKLNQRAARPPSGE